MNRLYLQILLVLSVCFVFFDLCWAEMEPGEWEITVETEIAGVPMKIPPVTYKQCITDSEPVPENRQPGQQCQVKDMQRKGSTITWTVVCNTGGGTTTGKGEVHYEGNQMKGKMEMQMEGMTMISNMKGRRLGPCKK